METMTWTRWAACLLGALAAGCGGAEDPSPGRRTRDHIEYELFETTRLLEPAAAESLAVVDDDGLLVFDPAPLSLDDLAPGDVLLAGSSTAAPGGLLRVVLELHRDGDVLTLRTAAAPLQLAFKKLDVRVEREVFLEDGAFSEGKDVQALLAEERLDDLKVEGGAKKRFDILVFDGDGDPKTSNDQVRIDATLWGGFGFDLYLYFDWGAILALPVTVTECLATIVAGSDCSIENLLPEVTAGFGVNPYAGLDVKAIGAAMMSFEKEFVVGSIGLPPIVLGPMVFLPTIEVVAEVEGGSSARFEVQVHGEAEMESSVRLSTKRSPELVPLSVKKYEAKATPPDVDLHAYASVMAGTRLGISLFGIAGPFATAGGEVSIHARPLDDPCWSLRFALEADLGFRVTTPQLPLIGYATIFQWTSPPFRPLDEEVASGTCVVPHDPPPPPGSGPNAARIQSPAFTPWAVVVGGDVDGTLADGVGFLASGDPILHRTVDGRYLVAGTFLPSLHKISEDGELVWQARLSSEFGEPLHVIRVTTTRDAGLLALLRARATGAFVLAKLDQAGVPLEAWEYSVPCVATPHHLMPDGAGGHLVLGGCRDRDEGWIVRTDGRGAVSAWFLSEAGSRSIVLTAGHAIEGDAVLAGKLLSAEGKGWVFALRLGGDGRIRHGTAWLCAERVVAEPRTVVPSVDGGITIVGESNGPGFVARVRKDGTLGFVQFPHKGLGVPDVLALSSVAELPVTGMVVGASYGDVLDDEPNSIVLAGLDGAGRTMWARRYFLDEPTPRSLAWPTLQLTDDGGVFVVAVASPSEERSGDLVAMKVHIKDGFLGEGTALRSENFPLEDFPCDVETRAFAPTLTEVEGIALPIPLNRG